MNILAIDHGTKKCGIAIAHTSVALPLKIVDTKNIIEELTQITKNENIALILIGIAWNMDGTESKQSHLQKIFLQEISGAFPKIRCQGYNEQYSSREAYYSLEHL